MFCRHYWSPGTRLDHVIDNIFQLKKTVSATMFLSDIFWDFFKFNSFKSCKNLSSWVHNLNERAKFISKWLECTSLKDEVILPQPNSVWLPAFFYPQGKLVNCLILGSIFNVFSHLFCDIDPNPHLQHLFWKNKCPWNKYQDIDLYLINKSSASFIYWIKLFFEEFHATELFLYHLKSSENLCFAGCIERDWCKTG